MYLLTLINHDQGQTAESNKTSMQSIKKYLRSGYNNFDVIQYLIPDILFAPVVNTIVPGKYSTLKGG